MLKNLNASLNILGDATDIPNTIIISTNTVIAKKQNARIKIPDTKIIERETKDV